MIFDVAVIGAGIVGSLTAMELSHYKLNTVLLEKANDVAMGTTKANSAIVHAGFDAKPGTLKAKLNVKGCAMMPALCKKLSVPYKNLGSLVVAFSKEQMKTVQALYDRGIANGVPGMEIYDQTKLRSAEPHINEIAEGALWASTAGVVCPYQLAIAGAENAVLNGVQLKRNFAVTAIDYSDGVFTISDGTQSVQAKVIVDCAGIHSGDVAKLIGDDSVHMIYRKGEYMLMDKNMGYLANTVIFQCPSEMGKGILVTKTVDGNLLVGPSSIDVPEEEDMSTTGDVLDAVLQAAKLSVPEVNTRNVITSFAGIRAHCDRDDFIIEPSKKNGKFILAAGIESPGLTAAPAIAEYIRDLVKDALGGLEKKESFEPARKAPVRFHLMNNEERKALIEKDKRYGKIICRCETITEGEILDAIHSPVPALDVDGVKRRTRAGMGRCQGGFCGSKVAEILAKEQGKSLDTVTKFGKGSELLVGKTK